LDVLFASRRAWLVTLEEIDQQLETPADGHEMTRVNALLTSLVAISVSLL
jgi:hypothetical protein